MSCKSDTKKAREKSQAYGSHVSDIYTDDIYEIPSDKNPEKTYRVRIRREDNIWVCSCPAFTTQPVPLSQKKPCKHIQRAQTMHTQAKLKSTFSGEVVLGAVNEVTKTEIDGKPVIMLPLVPLGNDHFAVSFEATMIYDALRMGVPLEELQDYSLLKNNSVQAIINHVRQHGRCIYRDVKKHFLNYSDQFVFVDVDEETDFQIQ